MSSSHPPHRVRSVVGDDELLHGRWRVERALSGQFGTVLILQEPQTGARHAAKTPHVDADLDARAVERFQAEARNWMELGHHENVVEAFFLEQFEYAGRERPFLFLEFVDGPTLEDVIRREGRLAQPTVLDVATGIAWGMAHAHGLERPGTALVHRDLKPENVFVTRNRVVKVSDFGIARALDAPDDVADADTGVGTPYYAAPEQMRDARLADRRSDVYSFGAVLFELLTGSPPFPAANLSELVLRVLREDPRPPSSLCPGIAADLDDLVLDCLAKDPDARPVGFDRVLARLSDVREQDDLWLPTEGARSCAVCGWVSATGRTTCSVCGATTGEPTRYAPVSRRSDRAPPTLGRRRGTSELRIEGVEWRPRRPRVGERVIVTVRLENRGAEPVSRVVVPFGLPDPDTFALVDEDGRRAYRGTIPPTAPGAPIRISWPILPLRAGRFRVRGPRAYYQGAEGQRRAARTPDFTVEVEPRDRVAMVGREQELDALADSVADAARGAATLVLLSGRPGCGKSRLGREAAQFARAQGFRVARGRCLDRGVEVRGAIKDAVRQLCGLASEVRGPAEIAGRLLALMDDQDGRTAGLVASVVDELLGRDESTRESPGDVWTRFAVAVARRVPLALVFEDVQRDAEVASIARWMVAAARAEGLPLLVVLTARPEFERGAGRELFRPDEESGTRVLRISPLTEEAATQLLEQQFAPNDFETSAPWLFEELRSLSGGNPLFLLSLVELLQVGTGAAEGLLVTEGGRWTATDALTPGRLSDLVPDRVEAVVESRLADLPETALRLLEAAAVAGDVVEVPLVRTVLEDPEWFDAAVSTLDAAGILRETSGSTPRLRFREPLLPEVVTRSLTERRPGESRRLNARFGELLAPGGRTSSRLALRAARHLVRAQVPDRAFPLLLRAVERLLSRQSYRRAANVLDEAASVMVGGVTPSAEDRTRFELLVGEASRRVGEFGVALRAYERLVGPRPTVETTEAQRAEAHERLGRVHAALGNFREAGREFSLALAAWRELEAHESHVLALADLAALHVLLGDGARARSYLGRADQAANEGETARCRARVEVIRARLELLAGRSRECRPAVRSALSAARAVRDRGAAGSARHALGNAQLREGRLAHARRSLERALSLHQRTGDRAACASVWCSLGDVALAAGELDRAQDRYTRGADMGREMGLPRLQVEALSGLAETALARGRPRRVAPLLEELHALDLERAETAGHCRALVVEARVAMATGRARDAQSRLSRAQALAESCDDQEVLGRVALARAQHAVHTGRPEIALRRAARGVDRPGLSPAVRVGLLALLAEQAQDVERAREAVAVAVGSSDPRVRAVAFAARGRVAWYSGDRRSAGTLLRRAVGQLLSGDVEDPLLFELLRSQAAVLEELDPAGAQAARDRATTLGQLLAGRGYVLPGLPTPASGTQDARSTSTTRYDPGPEDAPSAEPAVHHDYTCHLPNDLAAVPRLRDRFEAALRQSGMDGFELDGWKLVFTELVSNAIEHGCREHADRILVGYLISREEVVVHTTDPGDGGLEHEHVQNADASGFADTGRGAGLFLIREFSDEVTVERAPGGGTRVRVSKRRIVLGGGA